MTSRPSDSTADGVIPSPTVLDLDDLELDGPVARPAGTVVLLISAGADQQWAANAAIELSSRWARGGRRIVLADFHLETPRLHSGLDLPNLEGVVDIFLYGASLSRIAKPVRDGLFYLIPAGTYASDVGEIHAHPRWKKLVAGFRDTGAALVLFVPADGADLGALSKWSSEAFLLETTPDRDLARRLTESGIRVLGSFTPPAPSPAPAAPGEKVPPFTGSPVGRPRPRRTADPGLELPPPPVRRPSERRGLSALLWIIFAVIVVATAAYVLARLRPDLLPTGEPPNPLMGSVAIVEPVNPGRGPSRMGELLPYSVQIRAFTSLSAALANQDQEARRVGSAPFLISPERIQGILYYRILAGLATDTAEATDLRERLVASGVIDPVDVLGPGSLIQFAPLAFDLGEFDSLDAAKLRADSLADRSIPSYPVQVPYSDGSRRWQLYGGAFRDSVSASSMRRMLESGGLAAVLTARTGLPETGAR